MELRDLIVTPIFALMLYACAYVVRPYVTNADNRRYFIPALSAKVLGAIALGLIYQFYYDGGDTFNFHSHGSRHIWEAFVDSPETGVKLMVADGSSELGIYKYSSMIPFFRDPSSYTVIRLAALIDLVTFSTYSATALFFATFSFFGSWLFFLTFYNKYPGQIKWIALVTLFVPTVAFWGSGIMKDSIVWGCIGFATYETDRIFNQKRFSFGHLIVLICTLYLIFLVKKFVLQAFIPSAVLWIYLTHFNKIRSVVLKVSLLPFIIVAIFISGYFAASKIGEGDSRYSWDKLATTAKITAIDIRYQTGRDAGSGYTLGDYDGSFASMIRLAPEAINVSLFRPYLWEVRNPLMLMSAMESLLFFLFTLYTMVKVRARTLSYLTNPDISFTLAFSLIFAFAVGISTYNFGTLSRYKIPVMPTYALTLCIILHLDGLKRERKLEELDSTE